VLPVLSTDESRRLDREADVPVAALMERAGWAAAGAAIDLGAGYGSRVSVLAGPGDNGGDGWVAARRLAMRGCRVTVHQMAEPRTEASQQARTRAIRSGVIVDAPDDRIPADIVVDALFGAGIRGSLPGWIDLWSDAKVVVAAHVPSGLDPDTGESAPGTLRATATVAFHALSPGHLLGEGPDLCGRVTVADIGLSGGVPAMGVVTAEDARLPTRARTAHKWSAGSVLVVGGSRGMIGAPVMAAKAALRFGASAVGIAVPDDLMDTTAVLAPEILSYPQSDLTKVDLSSRFDVVVAGPGMGDDETAWRRLAGHAGTLVLDADALTPPTGAVIASRSGSTVLTPHAGELERLTGGPASWGSACEFADQTGAVMVFKGNPTFVCGRGVPAVVTSNGPELATIGSGDVLVGMIAASIARGLSGFDGAVAGAYWHGVAAADLATTQSVTADALVDHIGRFAGGRA
jgi:NAD(P)H-hydrate epimerase